VIPLHLKLSGFLSYREPAEVDFTTFHLACISGSNGAGKSSLLDAITWALFGQARKRDESLVNLQSKTAEVAFTFAYEGNIYRVLRSLPRGKTSVLEFQIAENGDPQASISNQKLTWRPLTERTGRDTQKRIEGILRLDYETFINVSFFLQGRADQFAQQPPPRRKEILGSILGLEMWEAYRERAAERRKAIERELDALDGRTKEIAAELGEEPQRKERLSALETELGRLSALRKTQESALATIKQARAALDKQAELVRKLAAALERSRANSSAIESRLTVKEAECAAFAEILGRADEVVSAYANWQSSRQELERWDGVASQFHEHEKRRQPYLDAINTEKAKLEQEREALGIQHSAAGSLVQEQERLEKELAALKTSLAEAEKGVARRTTLESELNTCREQIAGLRVENTGLKGGMDELVERIAKLEAADGAACPLCGQPLSPEHRLSTLEGLQAEGKSKGDAYRANKAALEELGNRIAAYEQQVAESGSIENERLRLSEAVAGLGGRLEAMGKQAAEWEKSGAKRLREVDKLLESEKFALPSRKSLAKVDKELAALGYDAAAHDAARRTEIQARTAEAEFRALESARSAIQPLENEVANLRLQINGLGAEIASQEKDHDEAAAVMAAAEASAPDLVSAERGLFDVQEQENRLNQEVGAARQKVSVLDELRLRQGRLAAEREESALQAGRYRTLERAFGKDGVPALLIEQALPEIEAKANELLDRLSDGSMSVRFITQSAYKDRKREDLKETLDIQLSDGAGVRDYEMYSGGEAFRANFAIRLALSEVLASRKGARLQMLVIDEGFGSQDEQGRQRLIQSINAVQDDFAKVLVITHLDELKDAFPTRIEVEKGEGGSTIRVL
jgi:exonuclease SbcC